MKSLFILAISLSIAGPAFADEAATSCPAPTALLYETAEQFPPEAHAQLVKATAEQKAALLAHFGAPPTTGDFDIFVLLFNDVGKLLVVQNDCLRAMSMPFSRREILAVIDGTPA